jgi:hypothetical protein
MVELLSVFHSKAYGIFFFNNGTNDEAVLYEMNLARLRVRLGKYWFIQTVALP